jgi:hypothetical protein
VTIAIIFGFLLRLCFVKEVTQFAGNKILVGLRVGSQFGCYPLAVALRNSHLIIIVVLEDEDHLI